MFTQHRYELSTLPVMTRESFSSSCKEASRTRLAGLAALEGSASPSMCVLLNILAPVSVKVICSLVCKRWRHLFWLSSQSMVFLLRLPSSGLLDGHMIVCTSVSR